MKKIALASDHAGFDLKNSITAYLSGENYEIIDFGCDSDISCDYADYAHPLAVAVENDQELIGIVCCGSGNGINMTVNKHQGIRSAICWTRKLRGWPELTMMPIFVLYLRVFFRKKRHWR